MGTDRRSFLERLGVIAAGLAAANALPARAAAGQAKPQRAQPPNIVIILSDDVGYGDLSCYGATHVHTPAIDSLAHEGLRFTNAHSDAATCTPSRYAMMTGSYAWRHDGVQILPGDAKLLIRPDQTTVATLLKGAGYRTGLVGKWHIGLGNGTIDWNGDIRPGPCEVGFDEAFFFAATADRVPTVYLHDHRVVNLDPNDPIHVSYGSKIGNEPTGREDPDLLKMRLSEGHDGTIVDGVSRIGFMTGGHAARWKDEEMAATFTGKAVQFVETNQHRPFLLYFTPSDIHVPRVPAAQFAGQSECGVRCDVINQLDWSVAQVLATLKRLKLENDTLVIFTSDNGPVVNDGYDDGADRALDGHKPAGPFRGGKYSIYEGGTRMPFLVRWPGEVKPGVSDALISELDLLASLAALTRQAVPAGQAADSQNVLPALLGQSPHGRTSLVEEARVLAIVDGPWKLVDRSQRPGAHPSTTELHLGGGAEAQQDRLSPFPTAPLELYNLQTDPFESHNVAANHPEIVRRLQTELAALRQQRQRA